MQEQPNTLQGILDIKPPLPPLLEAQGYTPLALSVLLAVLMAVLAYMAWQYFSNSRHQARLRVKEIIHSLTRQATSSTAVDCRHAAFEVTASLCDGLKLSRVCRYTKLPAELDAYQPEWEVFTQNLSAARYSPSGMKAEEVIPLAQEAMIWLKRWP